MSALLKDESETGLERSIWWIEYVIRHKGARLLKSNAVALPLWKFLLLDVVAFLISVLSLIVYVNIKIFKFVCRKICSRKPKTD